MTRDEFQAAAGTVIDDAVMADDRRDDPGWLDTIMRAHDAAVASAAEEAARVTAEFFGFPPVNLESLSPVRRPRRVTLRDPALPHQIVIFTIGKDIAVSCNCLRGIDGTQAHCSPLEVRYQWEPDQPMQVWRAHLAAATLEASGG